MRHLSQADEKSNFSTVYLSRVASASFSNGLQ